MAADALDAKRAVAVLSVRVDETTSEVQVRVCADIVWGTADATCILHMAYTKSVREKDWRSRNRGMQAT